MTDWKQTIKEGTDWKREQLEREWLKKGTIEEKEMVVKPNEVEKQINLNDYDWNGTYNVW